MSQGKEILKALWQKTKSCHNELEKKIFKENRIVHWGERNFGNLLIQGSEDVSDVFGDYISEIHFEPEVEKFIKKEGYIEIYPENLDIIRYRVDEL